MIRAALTQTVSVPASRTDLRGVARANVTHHLELLEAAVERGARLVCFGELFPAPYFALEEDPLWLGFAEDAEEGETISRVREAAAKHGAVVVAPIFELDRSGERFNTAVVIDERGRILGKYRKAHIPCGANEQGSFHETFYYSRSNGAPFFPVFRTSFGNLGVAICYDRHFEGVMASLAANGAQIVLVPSVTFGAKSRRMWHLEFPVDAARHNLFIGGSNRKGAEPPWNQPYFGESYFAGPDGVLPELSDHPELAIADVDLRRLAKDDPSGWNLPRDTRPDIYE